MRRIDVVAVGFIILLGGGLLDAALLAAGVDADKAGIWTQAVLFVGLMGWLMTYLFRVGSGKMTYHEQLKSYEDQVLQKKLDSLSPEELAKLQAEVEQERTQQNVEAESLDRVSPP
jgi:hypothetical protein